MKVFWTQFALDTLHDIYEFYKNNASVLVANNIKESILLSTRQYVTVVFDTPSEFNETI